MVLSDNLAYIWAYEQACDFWLMNLIIFIFCIIFGLQVWHVADTPQNDKFQYTYFAHKINSFDTAPKKLLASDSRLRPDRFALEKSDLSKAGAEKSRSLSLPPSRTHIMKTFAHIQKVKMKLSATEMELRDQ